MFDNLDDQDIQDLQPDHLLPLQQSLILMKLVQFLDGVITLAEFLPDSGTRTYPTFCNKNHKRVTR